MVFVPQGRFTIGRKAEEKGDQDESPRHPVIIAADFWLSRTEITIQQYRSVYTRFRVESWGEYVLDRPYQPAVNMNWHEADEFCRILTTWAREDKLLPDGYVFRLPTEAEWEYACRAGTDTAYYWGDDFGDTGAKFANSLDRYSARRFDWKESKDMAANDGYRVSAPAASFQPNAFGLHDLAGNVWEWCYDWYNPRAYDELPHEAPVQSRPVVADFVRRTPFEGDTYTIATTAKVLRGGSWGNTPHDLRCANRDLYIPNERNNGVGFRVVLAKKIVPEEGGGGK
jgi:formylglycine-generating enzyme required for sulfatase activity